MLKRIALISAVIVVNIVLLASIIIPHHHHENEVCIVNTHCHANEVSHDDDLASHEHEADNLDQCTLSKTFIVPNDDEKAEIVIILFNSLSDFVNLDYSIEFNSPEEFSFQHPPEIKSFYSLAVCASKGLRGPPIV